NYQIIRLLDYQIVLFLLDLRHSLRDDFLLSHRRLFVLACLDARRRACEQLARAGARGDDEFERVRQLRSINHMNVLLMVSATSRIRFNRARSASTIAWSSSTVDESSSLITMKSY